MTRGEYRISATDGTDLVVGTHDARGDRGPVVILFHGLLSHMGWYRGLGDALAAEGLPVYLPDRRGAGRSGGIRGHVGSWRTLVDDARMVAQDVGRRHPGRPLHAIGMSLGGAVALATSLVAPSTFERLSLLSPGVVSAIRMPLWRGLRLVGRAIFDPTRRYDLPFSVNQLTTRESWRRRLLEDPLRTRQVTARFLLELFRLQRFVRARAERITTPFLALLPEEDPLVDTPRTLAVLQRAGAAEVRLELLSGACHILPSVMPRRDLLARLVPWIRGTLDPPTSRILLHRTRLDPARDGDLPEPPSPESVMR